MTTAREDGRELFAICVDLDSGKIIHDTKVFDVAQPQLGYRDLNSRATPTPIVEDGRVYVHFGTYGLACSWQCGAGSRAENGATSLPWTPPSYALYFQQDYDIVIRDSGRSTGKNNDEGG